MALFHHPERPEKATRGHSVGPSPALEPVRIGAYLHSERNLYRVEGVGGERALIEDCRSGNLIDVPLSELLGLQPVQATNGGTSDTARS